MKRSIWNKQIPTLLGLILLAGSVAVVSWMSKNNLLFFTKASLDTTPRNVRITNVTDTSFSVSYLTADEAVGTLSYGADSSFGKIAFDDRDQETGTPTPQTLHHVTVRGLSPKSTYLFAINSGGGTYLNNDSPYQITTGPAIDKPPSKQPPLVGKISFPDGTGSEAIVFFKTDTAQTLSLLTKPDGSFTLPLNTLRTSDLSKDAALSDDTVITLLVIGSHSQSQVKVLGSQINPVPIVVLSKNYDFTVTSEPLPDKASPSAEAVPISGFPSFGEGAAVAPEPQILTPQKGETFTDQQPEFTGTAQPNETVTITIHSSDPVQTTVTAKNNGTWSYRPKTPLAPGTHTITIVTKDAAGVMKTITQSFTVFAEGSQFTEPSGAPSTTPTTVTATPTPTTAVTTPTSIPTATATTAPTVAPTTVPTLLPSPTTISSLVTPFPTTVPTGLPSTGSSDLPIFFIATIAMITIGGAIFLLTKGGIA